MCLTSSVRGKRCTAGFDRPTGRAATGPAQTGRSQPFAQFSKGEQADEERDAAQAAAVTHHQPFGDRAPGVRMV